jgi:hypothetical protein
MAAVGTSCHMYEIGIGGPFGRYVYRSDITHLSSGQYAGYSDCLQAGAADPECQRTPPTEPPPAEDLTPRVSALEETVNTIQSTLAGIFPTLSEIISAAEEEATAWRAGLDTAIADLRSSLINKYDGALRNITAVTDSLGFLMTEIFMHQIPKIWTSMDDIISAAEEEAVSWRKGILDLEGSLKAWISESILEILLTKLMQGK